MYYRFCALALGLSIPLVLFGQTPAPLPTATAVQPAAGPAVAAAPAAPAAPAAAARGGGRGGNADAPGDFLKRPPVLSQTPEGERDLLLLPEGYKATAVLTDPVITDPVGVTFDGNGRMYVLEMRSYMLDADGSDSRKPVSRISRHEDTDGDGIYDKHTVYADNLVLPRIGYPLEDGVLLVLETDNRDLYRYTDTDGDGVADKKEMVYPNYGRITNIEWQPGGMAWGLDNWIYTTYNPFRLRIAPGGKLLREETDVNGGEWGTNQDNYGKMWFVDGAGGRPVNFQTPIVYGAFNVPDNFEDGFQEVWGAPGGLGDMQGGMNSVRLPDQTLNRMTGATGPDIFRGDRLPKDMIGDLIFSEPVGRIVRRAKVVETDGLTQLRNAYPKSEFIRSTDPLFRPVNQANAPDGTVYVTDMYTGIIQEAAFTGRGSYLRRKIEQYSLDKQHNRGRIWRITYDGIDRDTTMPRMYSETAAQLVGHLGHPNGWWRDTAQKLLVLRQDKSVVPALLTLVNSSKNHLERIHALWTLEGLDSLTPALARSLMKDADPQVRIQAIRASESLYKSGPANQNFAPDYLAMTKDSDPNVVIQAMLTANLHKVANSADTIRVIRDSSSVRGVKEIASQILKPQNSIGQPASNDSAAGYLNLPPEDRRTLLSGEKIFRELCYACHGPDGKGATAGGVAGAPLLAPPLAGSARVTGHRDYVLNVLLNGLTGPVDGVELNGGAIMISMATNTDEWIADVANFVRNAFGNSGRPLITTEQVTAMRKNNTRKTPWTLAELQAQLPSQLTNTTEWKLSASHNPAAVATFATAGSRWDTGAAQEPNMWFQIELPQPAVIAELQLDATAPTGRATGGLGGFGGLGGGPVAPARGGGGGRGAGAAAGGGQAAGARGAQAAVAGGGGAAGRGGGGGRGAAQPPASGPIAYTVQVSTDGAMWSTPVALGAGTVPTTVIPLKPIQAKFIRVTQTGKAADGEFWAIQQVRLYQVPQP